MQINKNINLYGVLLLVVLTTSGCANFKLKNDLSFEQTRKKTLGFFRNGHSKEKEKEFAFFVHHNWTYYKISSLEFNDSCSWVSGIISKPTSLEVYAYQAMSEGPNKRVKGDKKKHINQIHFFLKDFEKEIKLNDTITIAQTDLNRIDLYKRKIPTGTIFSIIGGGAVSAFGIALATVSIEYNFSLPAGYN